MKAHKLTQLIEQHTQVFSPAKAYSHETYNSQGNVNPLLQFLQIGSTNRFAVTAIFMNNNPHLSIFSETPP